MKKILLSIVGIVGLTTGSWGQYEWNQIAPLKFTDMSFNVGGEQWQFNNDVYDTQEGDEGVIQLLSYPTGSPRPEDWQAMTIRQNSETGNFEVRVEMGKDSPTSKSVGFDYVGPSLDAPSLQGNPTGQYLGWIIDPNASMDFQMWGGQSITQPTVSIEELI